MVRQTNFVAAGAGAGGDVEKPLIPEDDRSPLESLSSRM